MTCGEPYNSGAASSRNESAVYRVKQTYEKPQGGFLAIRPRYPRVLSDDGLTVLVTTHPGRALD